MNTSEDTKVLTPLVFLERAGRFLRDEVALVYNDTEETFRCVYENVLKFKQYLQNIELKSQDKVAIISENRKELLYAHYAVPAASGIVVCLNPWLTDSQLIEQIKFSNAKFVMISERYFGRLRIELEKCVDVLNIIVLGGTTTEKNERVHYLNDEIAYYQAEGSLLDRITDEQSPICINFTSGTTGMPKGVVYTHRAAYLHSLGQVIMFGLNSFSNYLWTLPMFHVNGWGHMWAVVASGGRQTVLESEAATYGSQIGEVVKKKQVTHMAGAPRLIEPMIERLDSAFSGVSVMIGGASPSKRFLEKVGRSNINLIHQYGLNETIGPFLYAEPKLHWHSGTDDEFNFKLMRQGIPGMHIGGWAKVINDSGQEVNRDGKEMGQILLAGNTIFSGYYNNDAATKSAFLDGWFCTGDIAVQHEDGYIEIKDRMKDLIFVETGYGWENISSIEIENVIQSASLVRDVAIIGVVDSEYGGQKILGFVELQDSAAGDIGVVDRIMEHCRERLPTFKLPNEIIIAHIPKTSTGKVKKHELLARFSQSKQNHDVSV